MAKAGVKGHAESARLSADCRDICDLCAKILARKGPLSAAMCSACEKACRACGTACGKHPSMAEMLACSKSCAACVKSCQAVVQATK
jgi:hypothetical protein